MRCFWFGFLVFILCFPVFAKEIAFSFDDAPMADGQYFTGTNRAAALIEQLKGSGVEQAMFFCNTKRMDREGKRRLKAYAKAGHILANHTHSHWDLRETDAKTYLKDIIRAHALLKDLPNFRLFFRFPFLHEGETVDKRDFIRRGLGDLGYSAGYVTVDNYDFYMNKLFQDALLSGKKINFRILEKLYVKVLSEGVEFYDAIGVRTLGRSSRHLILLHENDLSALFAGSLAMALRSSGWKIISVEEAYRDPIAEMEPNTLFLGQGRVAAIAYEKGDKGPFWKWEEESELENLFADAKVFTE